MHFIGQFLMFGILLSVFTTDIEGRLYEVKRHNNSQPNDALLYISLCCHYCRIFIQNRSDISTKVL